MSECMQRDLDRLRVAAAAKVEEKNYWLCTLAGLETRSRFPLDFNRPVSGGRLEGELDVSCPDAVWARLLNVSGGSDSRLHVLATAGFALLSGRYTGNRDVVLCSPLLDGGGTAGMINAIVPLRISIDGDSAFRSFLGAVKSVIADAYRHRNFPIEVLEELLSASGNQAGANLRDVAVMVDPLHNEALLDGAGVGMAAILRKRESGCVLTMKYYENLYKVDTVRRIAEHFFTLMDHVLSDPGRSLDHIPMISAAERELVLNTFAHCGELYPAGETLADMFAHQVEESGDRIACVAEDRFVCYRELNRRAARVATDLGGSFTYVGLMVGDNLNLPLGMMGIVTGGHCLVPLSPSFPLRRLAFIVNDCHLPVLLCDRANRKKAGDLAEMCPSVRRVLCLEAMACEDRQAVDVPGVGPMLDSPCYIIYTSGSTGQPKGVRIHHRTLTPLLYWARDAYGLGAQSRGAQIVPFFFDFGMLEIFSTFLWGGVLFFGDFLQKAADISIVDFMRSRHINTVHLTPGLFARMVPSDAFLPEIKVLHLGGERLTGDLVRGILPCLSEDCTIFNGYGPTETSIIATTHRLPCREAASIHQAADIPIGLPVANSALYILDKNWNVLPIGVVGEICIGGGGVSPGYLNRPLLTAERFVADPFQPGGRMYLTGDLGHWLPDGSIQFAGRIDQQVKIRGYRIELGEIENRLLENDAITRVVVIDRDIETAAGPGATERCLCAYVTVSGPLDEGAVRSALLEYLPDYMVPAYIIPVDSIPLTPNGKIDRKGLPLPRARGAGAIKPPSNDLERALCRIWARLLKVDLDGLGVDTNVFELGANSLTVTAFVSAVFKELKANLEIADVFARPTVSQLAPSLSGGDVLTALEIEPREKLDYYDISYAQRRLWILCQFDEDSAAYNIPGAVTLSGPFDPIVFTMAVERLMERHESLRTSLELVRGKPRQRIHDSLEPPVDVHDLSALPEAEAEERAHVLYLENTNTAFDLARAPLFRFTVIRMEDARFIVVSNVHHIVSDGWSQGIVLRELGHIYNDLRFGQSWISAPLTLQYKDYTYWHNQLVHGGVFAHCRDYWLDKFADKPNGVVLPVDRPRRSVQTFNGGRVVFSIGKGVRDSLVAECREREATLFMGLLTLVSVLLARYSGQEDILLGSPIAARKHPALHPIVGFFVNTLVYRLRLDPNASFRDLLEAVKQEALDCYKYQDYPFDLMVEELELQRDMSQSPVFNVMLAHNNTETRDSAPVEAELTVTPYARSKEFNMSKFDLTFFIDDGERGLYTRIEYNSDLFNRSTIQRMGRDLQVLLDDCLARSGVPVHSLNLLAEEERELVLETFNRTECPFPEVSVVRMFQQRAEKAADRAAILFHDKVVTYGECLRMANRWAHWLRDHHGVSANDIVGLYVPRSVEMIVLMMGVLKAGTGYLALDPSYPEERLLYVLENSGTKTVLNGRPEDSAMFARYDGLVIDTLHAADQAAGCSDADPGLEPDPTDILYVNYTSGSTGTPNGALLTHGNLANLIQWQANRSPIDMSLRCLQFTSINFCVSFQEIVGTLTGGGQLVLIGHVERQDTMRLCGFLERFCIETLYLPFSYLNFLFNESSLWQGRVGGYLKHIVTAGEQLKISSGLKSYLETHPAVQLHNHYGSTEMHVVTSFSMDSRTALSALVPPVGKPVANVNIYILDDYMNPVPIGVYGELCVAGSHEIAGYIANPALNAAKLIPHPFKGDDSRKIYRSGDLGRWLETGDIELKGRKDFQVKIRGFRVEPGEIESRILAIVGVQECAVVVKEDPGGQKYLAAYISIDGVSPGDVASALNKSLPRYMIPLLVRMESLPLMPNGKIDLERLPEPEFNAEGDVRFPENETQRELARLWIEILDLGDHYSLGIDADFFALGGHSLKAAVLVSRIHRDLAVDVSLSDFFKGPTIRELSAVVASSPQKEFKELVRIDDREFYPLSFHQERMMVLQRMAPESSAYNMPGRMTLNHDVDRRHISAAVNMLLRRHESLRTGLVQRGGEAVQFIAAKAETPLEFHDLSTLTSAERDERLNSLVGSVARWSFDLAEPPLLRIVLVKSGELSFDLLFCMHHIISDGWSIQILKREFAAIYENLRNGAPLELQPLEFRYVDFAAMQRRWLGEPEESGVAHDYWRRVVAAGNAPLALPYDGQADLDPWAGAGYVCGVDARTRQHLLDLATSNGSTLFAVMFAVYLYLLSDVCNQRRASCSFVDSGREHASLHNVIGFFVQTVLFGADVDPVESFGDFLRRVNGELLRMSRYKSYPVELALEELGAKYPDIPASFNMLNMQDDTAARELEAFTHRHSTSEGDVKFALEPYVREYADGILITWKYSRQRFKPESIEYIANRYIALLEFFAAQPDKSLRSLRGTSKKRRFKKK